MSGEGAEYRAHATRPGVFAVAKVKFDLTRPSKPIRVVVTLSKSELHALDHFRSMTRMQNRAAAFREILRRALRAVGDDVGTPDERGQNSTAQRARLIH
jgi:hypothetical protein